MSEDQQAAAFLLRLAAARLPSPMPPSAQWLQVPRPAPSSSMFSSVPGPSARSTGVGAAGFSVAPEQLEEAVAAALACSRRLGPMRRRLLLLLLLLLLLRWRPP